MRSFTLSQGKRSATLGWTSRTTWATLGAAAGLLAAFAVEWRATTPLLRLGLLRSRWVGGANVLVFLAAAGQYTAFKRSPASSERLS